MNIRLVGDLGIGKKAEVIESILARGLEDVKWNPATQEGSRGY
jgi:hypothetical protein